MSVDTKVGDRGADTTGAMNVEVGCPSSFMNVGNVEFRPVGDAGLTVFDALVLVGQLRSMTRCVEVLGTDVRKILRVLSVENQGYRRWLLKSSLS
jgi:hypothetical protein